MSESNTVEQPVTIKEEIAKAAYEPLLPTEKKLIGWSLGIGLILLVALALINRYLG